jgi:lysophospholipase L1-like esterase
VDGLFAPLEVKWPKNRTFNIVFHGHSVPSGYHKTPDVRPFDSYPHLFHVRLKELYPHAVINVIVTAIGGEDSVAGAARFEADVLRHKPDLVFIDYALNDRRKSPEQVEAAWRSMVALAGKNKVPVVLMTPTGDSAADLSNVEDPLRQRADLIRRVAKEEEVLLADVSAAWQAEMAKGTPQNQLLSQPNHPNRRGHEVALGAICECLGLELPNR